LFKPPLASARVPLEKVCEISREAVPKFAPGYFAVNPSFGG
jgi:hypothetical protein